MSKNSQNRKEVNINIINVRTVLFYRVLRDKTHSTIPSFCIVTQPSNSVLREKNKTTQQNKETQMFGERTFLTGGQAGKVTVGPWKLI